MGIPMLKKRRSWDHFILNMGIPILVRRHFHTDTAPRTYADSLSIELFGTNFSAKQIEIQQISFKKIMVKMLYAHFQPFCSSFSALTHWGWVTHMCFSKLTIIGSDNGLSPGRCQAVIWTNAGMLLIGPLGTNFSDILILLSHFHSRKCISNVVWKMVANLPRPQCVKKDKVHQIDGLVQERRNSIGVTSFLH